MIAMRKIGNLIEKLALDNGISDSSLCAALEINENQLLSVYRGQAILSFAQIEVLADMFSISTQQLLLGDAGYYEKTVVHCMNGFSDSQNREMILDFIDAYISICEAVSV